MQTPSPLDLDVGDSRRSSYRFDFEPSTVSSFLRELSSSTDCDNTVDLSVVRYRSTSTPAVFYSAKDRCNERKRKYELACIGEHGVIPMIRRTVLASTSGLDSFATTLRVEFYHGGEARFDNDKAIRPTDENLEEVCSTITSELTRKFKSII